MSDRPILVIAATLMVSIIIVLILVYFNLLPSQVCHQRVLEALECSDTLSTVYADMADYPLMKDYPHTSLEAILRTFGVGENHWYKIWFKKEFRGTIESMHDSDFVELLTVFTILYGEDGVLVYEREIWILESSSGGKLKKKHSGVHFKSSDEWTGEMKNNASKSKENKR